MIQISIHPKQCHNNFKCVTNYATWPALNQNLRKMVLHFSIVPLQASKKSIKTRTRPTQFSKKKNATFLLWKRHVPKNSSQLSWNPTWNPQVHRLGRCVESPGRSPSPDPSTWSSVINNWRIDAVFWVLGLTLLKYPRKRLFLINFGSRFERRGKEVKRGLSTGRVARKWSDRTWLPLHISDPDRSSAGSDPITQTPLVLDRGDRGWQRELNETKGDRDATTRWLK